jgi:hypothetical protein
MSEQRRNAMTTKRKPVEAWRSWSPALRAEPTRPEPTECPCRRPAQWGTLPNKCCPVCKGTGYIVRAVPNTPELRAQRAVVRAAEEWCRDTSGEIGRLHSAQSLVRAVKRYLKAKKGKR